MTEPVDIDFSDPDSVRAAICAALRVDPQVARDQPWQGFALIWGFSTGHRAQEATVFDGSVDRPTSFSARNPAFRPELSEHFRTLTADPSTGPWRTWVIVYNAQTDTFTHRFLWPGEDDGWNVLDRDLDDANVASLNPVDTSVLETPFSERAAVWLHSRYALANRLTPRAIRPGKELVERLEGGWRVSADPSATAPSRETPGVFLVADNQAVTITDAPLAEHPQLLAQLLAG